MSSNASPESYGQPSFLRRYGCLIILAAIVLLIVGGILFARYMIFHTPLAYRVVAKMIEKTNPNIRIEGITGDLQTGVNVSSIWWGEVPGSPSEILDLRVRYNGYGDAGKTHRLVINDAGVRRAHIDLADLPSSNTTASQTTTVSTTTSSTGVTTTTTTTSTSSPGGYTSTSTTTWPSVSGSTLPNGIDSVEVERVAIEDVLITNRNSDFRLSIPKIEWTGFKATATSFEPGVLTVESDRLTLHTEPGRTVQEDGKSVTFQKLLKGTAQPTLHPAIKQPISFAADLSFLPQGEVRPFHIVTAEGKLEVDGTADGGGSLHARQLDLASFIDPKKLFGDHTAELPSDVVLTAVATTGFTEGKGTMKIAGGSFRLGVSTFQIEPLEFTKTEQNSAVLRAILKTDAGDIVWALPLANFGDAYHPHFISSGMKTTEILSRVFAGRPYEQLSAEEKKAIDARVPIYDNDGAITSAPLEK